MPYSVIFKGLTGDDLEGRVVKIVPSRVPLLAGSLFKMGYRCYNQLFTHKFYWATASPRPQAGTRGSKNSSTEPASPCSSGHAWSTAPGAAAVSPD